MVNNTYQMKNYIIFMSVIICRFLWIKRWYVIDLNPCNLCIFNRKQFWIPDSSQENKSITERQHGKIWCDSYLKQ